MVAPKAILFHAIILICVIFTESEISNNNVSIIVIGAGPSGIAVATKLLRSNFTNIKILEAENRIGGRVNSVKFGDDFVDLGAQFCHGEEDNIVYHMVKDLNVLKHLSNEVELVLSNGKKLEADTQRKIMNFGHSIDASENDEGTEELCQNLTSIGDCFDLKYDSMLKDIIDEQEKHIFEEAKLWLINYLCGYDSNFDLHDLARKSDYKKCKGDLFLNWNGRGYKTILEVMMGKFPHPENALPMDDKIFINQEVINIKNWEEGDHVVLTTKNGDTHKADHVIFTPSLGVLKADYETLFDPPLPEEKVNAIKGTGFGAMVKIVMKFRKPVNKSIIMGTIWSKEDLDEAEKKGVGWLQYLNGVDTAENNPHVLICFYAGGNVTDIEKLTDNQVSEGHKYLVSKFLNSKFGVSEPEEFKRSSWYSNPHFRGTYSYESVEGRQKYGGPFQGILSSSLLNKDQKLTVLFAGEATHPYYFSTVHGAIETGYREANKLIKYYKDKN